MGWNLGEILNSRPMFQALETYEAGAAMNEFLNMGGYAGYVWPAYALSAAVLIGLAAQIWLRGRALATRLKSEADKTNR